MATPIYTLLLIIAVCIVSASASLTWTECETITDTTPKQNVERSHRAMTEKAYGLEEGSLRNKESDSEFMKSVNDIIMRRSSFSIGGKRPNTLKRVDVPAGVKTLCTIRSVPYHQTNVFRNRTVAIPIDHFAKKYVHLPTQAYKGSIFLLQGGPGAGGEALEPLGLKLWSHFNGQYDIIIPDHRGTARSSPEQCYGDTEATFIRCQKLDPYNYDGLTTDDAAMDTITLMQEIKKSEPSGEILLYGVSYGTFVSERILNMIETLDIKDLVSAVVLDGICGGDYCDFTKADEGQEETALAFLDYCRRDATCSSKLGTTNEEILSNLRKTYQSANQCAKLFEGKLKILFASLLTDNVARLLIPAFVHRINRCTGTDNAAIIVMLLNFVQTQLSEVEGSVGYPLSFPVNINIGVSELKGRYGSPEKADAFRKSCNMCSGGSYLYPSIYKKGYIPYPESKFAKTLTTNIPLLLLNGDLDPQTSISSAEKYYESIKSTTPYSRFIKFPGVVHYVTGRSPMASDVNQHCGFNIVADFFKKKDANGTDTSCLNDLLLVPFGGYSYTDENIAMNMYDGFGLTRSQYIKFVLTILAVITTVLACCTCCCLCFCWICTCGPFKRKFTPLPPVVIEDNAIPLADMRVTGRETEPDVSN
ncbi:PPE1 [Acrasis kona]|uniref:PPE1 n=1 Tax=Acrasis kona TaxID=1008807 RepID=A0AAW2YV96_9EUKA